MSVDADMDDVVVTKKAKKAITKTTKTKRTRKNAKMDGMEEEEEEEEAVMNSNPSEDSMSLFENLEVPELPTSNLLPIIQEREGSTAGEEEVPNVFDISTIVGMRL